MASHVEGPFEPQKSPKLPVLREGQNSLVCGDKLPSPLSARDLAADWATETRKRIQHSLHQRTDVSEDDIRDLKQELVPIFVVCLQQDTRHGWKYLIEVLSLLEPFHQYFDLYDIKDELYHYLERIVWHVKTYKEKLFDLHIVDALQRVFPKEIAKLQESDLRKVKNYCVTVPPLKMSSETPSPRLKKIVPTTPNLLSLPDGSNPYSMYISTEEQLHKVKPLTFGDLRKSIAVVAMDVAGRESIWGNASGPVAKALQTDIPEEKNLIPKSPEKEQGGYKLTPRSGVANFTAAERKFKKTPRIDEPDVPVMTGRDAVAYFVTANHSGQIKSLFFNYAQSRYFRPYDLICVHKNKIDPEHFVFSTFGVLHVYPDNASESLALADWQREAVLWKAVSGIPFFKNYLIKKMFDRWRANKLYLDYLRKQQAIASTLLPAVPSFGTAMLQVMRLLKELITITFLPFETDVMYQLSDFENNVNYKNIKAEKILEKFFTYCRMVADVTAEESFNKLHYCEEQVKKKTYFSKDSLHMQKYKKEQREENLQKARSETGRLGNFVKLVDQMIVEHMFYLTKTQVLTFVKTVINIGPDVPRDGFFKANLVFTKQDVLGISPTKEKFTRVLMNTLKGIPTVLCANAIPIDGSISELATDAQTPPDETDSLALKSEQAKSSQDFRHMERRKSTAATSSIKQGSQAQMSEAVSMAGDNMTVVSGAQTERTLPLSKTKSVFGDDGVMRVPEIPLETPRTKEEDEIGIATPDLVIKDDGQNLVVEGEGFMGQYKPLSKASLEEKLEKDDEFQEMLKITNNLLSEAMEEIDSYCEFNKWLNEIHIFCKKWTDKSVREYKGEQAFTIEQKLTELRQWSEKVRNFDRYFQTASGLFFVDCSHIHDILLPRLRDIYDELVTFVAEEARSLAVNFCDDMKLIIANMKDKQQSVDAFALFAKNYNQYKKNTGTYQQKVEYIKSLYEVIRMSSRQLTSDEEKYEENVWAAWEAFLLQMQDASEFVNTQTPLMTQLLEDSYQGSKSTSLSEGEVEPENMFMGSKSTSLSEGEVEPENMFMDLEREAYELEEQATTGKFLNPDQNPSTILIELTKIRDKFYSIQRQLQEASKWREAICGEPYDLSFLTDMTVKLEVRQELWKYVEVSTHAIREWKGMLFKKMNIKKALEKIIEWQGAASQLKPYLPMGDKVLTTWFKSLQNFKKFLPILHKLANDALKERHWKAIFVGMNESYDHKRQFTVADLLTYDLEDHAQLIGEIYLGAVAEYDLELKIGHLQKFWLEREFKLAKHIPDSLLQSKDSDSDSDDMKETKTKKDKKTDSHSESDDMKETKTKKDKKTALQLIELKKTVQRAKEKRAEPKKPSSPRRRTKLEKYRQEKAAAAKDGTPRGLNVADDDYYVLIEVEDLKYQLEPYLVERQETAADKDGTPRGLNVADDDYYVMIEMEDLKYQLEDSRITIMSMMQSPFLGDMTAEVESWYSALQQVEEITDLWFTCQKKWMYLLKVFEWPELFKRFKAQAPKFEDVHNKFKDWMRVVSHDPKVLTVINRRRGEKGYRLLQGDNLRSLFLQLIEMQEEILKHLSSLMDTCRQEFTRLYFLSDEELVEMLGVSRNPQALTPYAKKCFPGINSLAFALPPGTSSLNSHLDFALHADKLQVIALRGLMGEEVPLFAHLEAQPKSTRWLKLLEGIMKNTMATILQACVQTRMEDGGKNPAIHILEELQELAHAKQPTTTAEEGKTIEHAHKHWLLRFPAQCIYVAEGILWERNLHRHLEKTDLDVDDLKSVRSNGVYKLDQYIEILKELHKQTVSDELRNRLYTILCVLVNQSIEQRDTLDNLVSESVVSDKSFSWLKTMRYHMDIRTVLRAKQEPVDQQHTQAPTDPQPAAVRKGKTRRHSIIAARKMEQIDEPSPQLSRTKTSVSTDHQFSRCYIQQLGNTFNYDYEYLGPMDRLVLTPLTERAFLSLTQTLKNFHCGTLMGPPGTGKSETVKDLAKIFGCNLFTVNCNQDITLPMMTQYMMGMVQSGSWALFDDTDRLTKGLMSVTAQHLDYIRTAMRTLEASSENQYKIRGQPRYDKKTGVGDAVIRRNSLTTLHPLPNTSMSPVLERQKTVPHGFNEKGLVTYFEETWIAEKDQRRHSIEREIEIQESELYSKNKPPPLFYEHARFKGKKASPDYSLLLKEAIYKYEVLGNVMFNGKLIQASSNYGCFMTLNMANEATATVPDTFRFLAWVYDDLFPAGKMMSSLVCDSGDIIFPAGNKSSYTPARNCITNIMTLNMANQATATVPDTFRTLLRPCAIVLPDFRPFIEITLLCNGYLNYQLWARKLTLFTKLVKMQLPRKHQYNFGLKELRLITKLCVSVRLELEEAQLHERQEMEEASRQTGTKVDTPPLVSLDQQAIEEQSIVLAIIDVLQPTCESEDEISTFLNILRDIFPTSTKSKSMSSQYQDTKLVNAVRDQLNEDNMKETQEIMDKILQLYSMIQQKQSVILSGPSGSGKSTCLGVLARALNRLNFLLFAPDHSKDELATERDLAFQVKHKLSNAGMDEFIPAEEEIGAPKTEQSKGTKKIRQMTTTLTKVQEAIHELEVKKSPEYAMYPKIDLVRLNPTALTSQELLGHFEDGLWKDGLLQKILGDAHFMNDAVKTYLTNYKKQEQPKQKHKADLPSVLLKWVVMDGALHPNWTEGLNTVVDQERKMSLANGGQIPVNVNSTQILFESTNIANASPSIISHCSITHFGDETVAWNSLFESWAKTAKSKWIFTSSCMKVILDLVKDVFGPTLKFLNKECCTALLTDVGHTAAVANRVVTGVQEVTSFVMVYSALLDKGYSRDEFEKKIRSRDPDEETKMIIVSRVKVDGKVTTPSSVGGNSSRMTSSSQIENGITNYMEKMKNMFAIAYIWAFGGHLHDRYKDKFSKFAHDVLYRATHPIRISLPGTVFDYTMEESSGSFIRWNQKSQERPKSLAGGYVVTPEVEKYAFWVELLINSHQPVLITGQPGVGKTSLIHSMISSKHNATNILMSPGMTSAIFQETLMAYIIDMKSKALNVITSGQATSSSSPQKHLFFIDDLNTADNSQGYQPTLELLTQMLSQGGVYDRQRKQFQEMNEAIILAAATLPSCPGVGMGQSCHVMSSRLTRLFMNIHIFFPNADGILSTFGRNIQHWLEEFPTYSVEHHFEFATALTMGLLELYHKVREKFRPTPAHPHYIFSLHDISRVVQGILLMSPRTRTRKMMKIKKDKRGSNTTSRQTSLDSRGRASNPSDKEAGSAPSPPMMKVIAQLWCHECTRTFADRLVTDDDMQWYNKVLEEIVIKQFCSARDDPRTEMAAISEETFSQSGVHTPPISPPPPHNISDIEGEGDQDEGPTEGNEEQEGQQGSSESSKSFNSASTSRASQVSKTSHSTRGSSRKRMKTSTPDDETSEMQSVPLDLGTSDESTQMSAVGQQERAVGAASETEYETEEESDTDTETETETETEATETPRDMTSTQVDESSRGTSRTSGLQQSNESSKSTDSSDQELTDRSTRDRKLSQFSDDYMKGMTPRIRKSIPQRGSMTSSRHVHFKPGLMTDREHIAYFGPLMKMEEGETHRIKKSIPQRGSMTSSRHVHFKPGLMTDREHIAYFGPLIKLEEIKGSQESLSDFLFSKYYMTTHTETHGMSIEKGENLDLSRCPEVHTESIVRDRAYFLAKYCQVYRNSFDHNTSQLVRNWPLVHIYRANETIENDYGYADTSEEMLTDALQTCLNVYNLGTSQRLEIVFFKEAVRHAARLSRVLALTGGHAVLLGTSYSTGRATLVRMASYIAHCKLYEPKRQTDPSKNLRIVREHIKRACHHTGILGKPTVLLVHEDLGVECLQDVAALMAGGTSPGLYTEDEMQSIVSQMMPGGVQTKKIDKIEQAFERFLRRVKQHLHVVVCLSYRGNIYSSDLKSLHKVMCKYPNLVKYSCCIDHYQPWSYQAYVKIARVWLLDERSRVSIPWHPTRKEEQVEMLSKAMAYIHMSVKTAIERQYCHQREPLRFFSPLTFMEFVHIFRIISAYIVIQETGNIQKHERALGKVNEAFGSISEFKREVSDLSPQHKAATDQIKGLVEEVEAQKADYIVALDKCKEQEQMIEALQGPLERLRKDAQSEFDKLNPNYKAAMKALQVLSRADIDEVKSFREPPSLVKYVVNALCLLFDKQQDWENGKLLMSRENFIQDLIFYDKDNIPEDIFQALCDLVKEPDFNPELVATHSKAAAGICMWVHSIQKYSEIHRNMQPRLKNLLEQEEKFTRAQAKLGQLRVDANRLKSALEHKIQAHKTAVKRAKTILKSMQNIEKKISRAVNLMENMSMQHFLWKSELKKAKHQIFTAPGDALITAACICYQGPLNDKIRAELTQDWLDRCKQGNFKLNLAVGQDVHNLGYDAFVDNSKERDSMSEVSSSQTDTQSEMGGLSLPEVRTFRYQPVVYDTSKYYKSELKRHGSMEYEPATSFDTEGSDDEEEQSPLMTRNGYSLQAILSDFDELSQWRLEDLPTDLHSIQNALMMRVSCYNRKYCWPLLIDPDNQAEIWVKAIQMSRNIFSEKDVREEGGNDTEDLPPVPSSDDKDEDLSHTPNPPSRGTAITFSDYTLEHDGNTTRRTSSTSTTYTTDYTKSMGRHSRNTWDSEQIRPVTSVTASWEHCSLHPDQTIVHPEHNLWIIEADNPELDSRLINAIVHGVTVLVTHLERKPINPLFRGLLLKHYYVDKEGYKVVRVSGEDFRFHPNFCLYLSTSVPLFLKGDGLHNIPLHRMCIINMSLSDEAIINYLLHQTMKVERKEFEGQKRSNENDIIRHRQKLVAEHEMIREKTLNLFGPILEDQTMLDSLINCQKEVERNRMILEETRYMGDHLEEKFSHYVPMIMQATMLYNLVQRMSVLHSYYYMPFYKFVEMFTNVIKSRDRGKGAAGAPASRAKELMDAIYTNIFKYVSMMMFEPHFLLLQVLVTLERLRLARKASAKELGIFLNGFDKQGLDDASLLEQKPAWLGAQEWIDCLVLEQLHHTFHGLKKSLVNNSDEWREYFQHPVSLMNTVPGTTLQELSIFQKCILWKMAQPDKLSEIADALILSELGNIRTIPDHYNIREVYGYTTKTTPVVFVLPNDLMDTKAAEGTKGLPYVSPTHEVKRLAKEVGMEGKVKVMNFGVEGHMSEVRQAVEDCIQTGYWLLLQNYHLAEEPEPEFFQLLKDIVYTKWEEVETEREKSSIQDDKTSLVTYTKRDSDKQQLNITNTFRLWITTQSDSGRLIPGVLVQHGIKVTAESTGNFKSTLQKAYRSVAFLLNNFEMPDDQGTVEEKTTRIMPLALLHSLLLQQCYYGNGVFMSENHWSLTDLAMAVDMFKKVMLKGDCKEKVAELVSQVYTDHCTDITDYKVVKAIVQTLAKYAALSSDQIQDPIESSIVSLLGKLLRYEDGHFNLKRAIDSIEEMSARTFGLPDVADQQQTVNESSILGKDMVQVLGAPELFLRVTSATSYAVLSKDAAIPQYITMLQNLPMIPETNKNQVYPIDVFLHYEAEGYRNLVDLISADLNLLLRKSRGEILPSSDMNKVIYAINRNIVPSSWTSQTFESSMTISDWLTELSGRIAMLREYILGDKPATYNLSAFLRPDRFLESVKQTYARRQFKDIDFIEFNVEVMPLGLKPSIPPPEGVFISGLSLHNALWDGTRSALMLPSPDSPAMQEMPVFWVKPEDMSSTPLTRRLFPLYKCPVFCSRDIRQHGDKNVVVNFTLPSECDPTVWESQRAFLSTSLS